MNKCVIKNVARRAASDFCYRIKYWIQYIAVCIGVIIVSTFLVIGAVAGSGWLVSWLFGISRTHDNIMAIGLVTVISIMFMLGAGSNLHTYFSKSIRRAKEECKE